MGEPRCRHDEDPGLCLVCSSADEIVRLRAELQAAKRQLDQIVVLAEKVLATEGAGTTAYPTAEGAGAFYRALQDMRIWMSNNLRALSTPPAPERPTAVTDDERTGAACPKCERELTQDEVRTLYERRPHRRWNHDIDCAPTASKATTGTTCAIGALVEQETKRVLDSANMTLRPAPKHDHDECHRAGRDLADKIQREAYERSAAVVYDAVAFHEKLADEAEQMRDWDTFTVEKTASDALANVFGAIKALTAPSTTGGETKLTDEQITKGKDILSRLAARTNFGPFCAWCGQSKSNHEDQIGAARDHEFVDPSPTGGKDGR